jgi:hypothetical protein
MVKDKTRTVNNQGIWISRIYLILIAVQGLVVLYNLFRIPTEPGVTGFFGFSLGRLAIIVGVAFITLATIWLLLRSLRDPEWLLNVISRFESWLNRKNNFGITLIFLTLCALGGIYFILVGYDVTEPFSKAYFVRLGPIAYWLVGFSILSLIAIPLIHLEYQFHKFKPRNKILLTAFLIFGFFLMVWLWIAWSRIGLEAESVGWNSLGPPILETQILIAWVVGIVFLILSPFLERGLKILPWPKRSVDPNIKFDILVSILIWLAAIVLWNSIPLTPSWFVSPPRSPNYEIYPNSDAILYDTTAQSFLVGEGFKSWGTPYASRPMYALFIGVLHSIGGLDYEPIILFQVAVLAIFPVLLYWMSRILDNRLSGVIIAVLIILREANAILLNDEITVSHSKLIMADFPTTVGIGLFCVVVLTWLQKPELRRYLPLVAGGILGAIMLVRPEVGVQLLVVGVIALLVFYRQPTSWLKSSVLLSIGMILVLSPWIWRNYQIDGKIFLDQPNFRADLFAKRYSEEPEETSIKVEPGESYEEYSERMTDNALEFIQEQPKSIGQFILSHYMNSQVQTVLVLPTTFRLIDSGIELMGHKSIPKCWEDCCSVNGYIRRLPFWFKWDGVLPHQSIIPILINLLLVALGISVAWHRNRFIGLLPLGLMVAHLLINAVVRNSGGRYILPVDWVGIFYYGIGISHVTIWGFKFLTAKDAPQLIVAETRKNIQVQPEHTIKRSRSFWIKTILFIAIGLFLVGLILPISEKVISPRYQNELTSGKVLSLIKQDSTHIDEGTLASLETFSKANGTILEGRALYPRYHPANVGEPGEWRSFQPRPYPRISFYLVGPDNIGVILPTDESPDSFTHGTDVIVLGCYSDRYFDAYSVIIWDSTNQSINSVYTRYPQEGSNCPLPSLE